ncbi:MAG: uridine diphosphate-N-acetylglucosamine-binding protein YvcK [Anaerolineae bacterium]
MKQIGQFKQTLLTKSRWLQPGLGIKRWLILLGLGAILVGLGWVYLVLVIRRTRFMPEPVYDVITMQFMPPWARILISLSVGGILVLWSITKIGLNLIAPFRGGEDEVVDSLYEYTMRNRGPHIVAIGGGTGLPTLLRGLTRHTRNITAIVTVADDGGSSGRLRRDLGVLPPGDFRNNMAALARDEALMTQVLQYRFGGGMGTNGSGELQGHAFGNLLLAALTGITGSFDQALLAAERVLALRGRVLPSTLENVTLMADVAVGGVLVERVVGESEIPKVHGRIQHVFLEPPNAAAYPSAVRAIFDADLIVIGPGSLYTSILPNLLVPDLAQALCRTTAPKVYVCNLAAQPGETDNYTVADHVQAILEHTSAHCLDIVLANDNLSVPPDRGGGNTIYVQPMVPAGVKMVTADLVNEEKPWKHDSQKLATAVMALLK